MYELVKKKISIIPKIEWKNNITRILKMYFLEGDIKIINNYMGKKLPTVSKRLMQITGS